MNKSRGRNKKIPWIKFWIFVSHFSNITLNQEFYFPDNVLIRKRYNTLCVTLSAECYFLYVYYWWTTSKLAFRRLMSLKRVTRTTYLGDCIYSAEMYNFFSGFICSANIPKVKLKPLPNVNWIRRIYLSHFPISIAVLKELHEYLPKYPLN